MSRLVIKNLTKRFDSAAAVDRVSLDVKEGEFVTLLGPSGCGKTTTLRTVAGFYQPDDGEIYFNDRLMNNVPPNKRNTSMCFQSYALFPHMNVRENIAFGLKMRKVPQEEQKKRVDRALEMLSLGGLGERKPGQLSGGQQQRVALARAIVTEPDILLFDEPLSNLDAKLRVQVRVEIREMQKRLGITSIYVTHDQDEALAISDRIVVMNQGRIEQIGDPHSIYLHPKTSFVAGLHRPREHLPGPDRFPGRPEDRDRGGLRQGEGPGRRIRREGGRRSEVQLPARDRGSLSGGSYEPTSGNHPPRDLHGRHDGPLRGRERPAAPRPGRKRHEVQLRRRSRVRASTKRPSGSWTR